jgi:hypothetical protein
VRSCYPAEHILACSRAGIAAPLSGRPGFWRRILGRAIDQGAAADVARKAGADEALGLFVGAAAHY